MIDNACINGHRKRIVGFQAGIDRFQVNTYGKQAVEFTGVHDIQGVI